MIQLRIKVIELTKGGYALVDEDDYEYLNQYKWRREDNHQQQYAARTYINERGVKSTIRMHQVVSGYDMTDHINGDGLDNRKDNLRPCDYNQNVWNRSKPSNNTTGYKGVSRRGNRYVSGITHSGKSIYLGSFGTPIEAAKAYDTAARIYFGEYANINFKKER